MRYSSDRGMTLVELLIVITIMGLLGSLIAPLTTKALDRARAQEELIVAERTVKALALRAFVEGQTVVLDGRGGELRWVVGSGEPRQMRFESLFFEPAQRVTISPNGYADASAMSVLRAGRRYDFALNGWLDDK